MLLGGHTRCFHMHEYLVVLAYESFAIVGIDAGNWDEPERAPHYSVTALAEVVCMHACYVCGHKLIP